MQISSISFLIFTRHTSGRFYGKLQSRSFPELSDNVKEKQPVRQMSDNSPSTITLKLGQNNKQQLPVASTKYDSRVLSSYRSESIHFSFRFRF
jgi:hypothetical protein